MLEATTTSAWPCADLFLSLPLQLNLSNNRLCGVWEEYENGKGIVQKGVYTVEGINAVADALRVHASLTSVCVVPKLQPTGGAML